MLMLELWKKQPGDYFCICTKSITGQWKEHFIRKGEWQKAKELVRNNMDKDLYMCPHGFSQKKRRKGFSVDPLLIYADLDEVDPRDILLKPTIAIESSPGRFVGYWVVDKPVDETLNRRMSYFVGADKSGWDRTQVLRIPNTRNFKYNSSPRVRILWTDGPTYKIGQLEEEIPGLAELTVDEGVIDDEAVTIYKKYEEKVSPFVRRELFRSEVKSGKRSEVLWKLNNHLIEAGCTREEAFKLLWISAWNKFRERRDGAEQLWRELDKSLEMHLKNTRVDLDKVSEPKEASFNPFPQSMAEVEMENIDWIIPGLMARREMTIVEGDPGLGKSYFVQMVAAAICDGKLLPVFPKYKKTQGRVAYFDTENTPGSVTKPRLVENGVERLDNYFQCEEFVTVDNEDQWENTLDAIDKLKPEMVVFDTINTYIGGADTYKSSETQQAMSFFKEIAVRFNCSVVVLRHLTKGSKEKALYRGQGSIAFTGAARIVATVGRDPEDQDTRVVACTKNNISVPFPSFTYTIEGLPDTVKLKNRSRLVWGDTVDLTADQILAAPKAEEEGKSSGEEKVAEWLQNLLRDNGRMKVEDIIAKGEARSYTATSIRRAATRLEVDKKVKGRGTNRHTWWSMEYAG